MNRNVRVVFGAGLLSAFILGIFELLFPFYLDYRGVSLIDMGLIFTFSTLIISFLRVFLGEFADVYGRKKVYLASCTLEVTARGLFPFSASELQILVSKFLNDLGDTLRLSVHNVMLYENARRSYAKLFSWFTASNFILQATGTLCFAFLLAALGYSNLFFLLAGVEATKLLIALFYEESKGEEARRRMSLREAYSFKIGKDLRVLALSSAIGSLGFGVAHGFLLPLYFVGKYGLDATQISVITAVHRLSFLTTPVSDTVIKRLGLKRTFILSTLAYVLSFLGVGLITFPIVVFVAVFIVHDLFGGGIRMTAVNVILQNLTADETRGREVNAFNTIQTPMTIIAPSVAGILAAASWDYIFIAGGLLWAISLLVFCGFFEAWDRVSESGN